MKEQVHRRSSFDKFISSENLSSGQISLSPLLVNAYSAGILPDNRLAPEDVTPLLTDNLQWRITTADHSNSSSYGEQREVPVQNLVDRSQLRVAVVSRDVEPIQAGEEHLFPRYGEWVEQGDVTKGKTGGV
jgi:tyrosinase